MYTGSDGVKSLGDVGQNWLLDAVSSSGAVSPATRAMERNTAVMMAGRAAGTVTRTTVCQWLAPRAKLASRRDFGTNLSASSEARMTIGSIITPRANEPA